jgi:choline-sulfatase
MLCWAIPVASGAESADSAPGRVDGVVLVTIDTLRADHVGAYGGAAATPALDRLASEGVLLEQATTPVPSTGPAHVSLMTGLYPWRHGALANAVPLDPGLVTLAPLLSEQGFRTGAFVSSYIVHSRFGFNRGFGTYHFEPTEGFHWRGRRRDRFWSRGEATVAAASRWLGSNTTDRFFLWVHLFDPHTPYLPPPGFALSTKEPVDLGAKRLPSGVKNMKQLAQLNRQYRGEVSYADAQVGRLVAELARLELADRTAVIVTSDHGEGLGDHGLLEHGQNVFDELVRVPLIVRAAGLPAGRRLSGPAQLEDLMPTILALVDVRYEVGAAELDGFDLSPWLRGTTDTSPRSWAVGRRRPYPGRPDLFFARRWPQKWMGSSPGDGEAYALDSDPGELAGRTGKVAPNALEAALQRAGSKAGSTTPDPDPEVRRALEALGYIDK